MEDFWRNFRWPNIAINKYLFRFIIGIFIFVFLVSQLYSGQFIFSKLLKHPELRHFAYITRFRENNRKFRLTAGVVNRGFGPAHNVLVHVSIPGGEITSFRVDSQELYSLVNSDLQGGQLNIWLDRLTSNAKIEISLIGTFNKAAPSAISVSAASDEGSSLNYDIPTLTEELSGYVWRTCELFVRAKNYVVGLDKVQNIGEYLHSQPVYRTLTSEEMADIILAGLLIIFIFWTFVRRKSRVALIAGIIATLLTWLIADFTLPAPLVLGPVFLIGYLGYCKYTLSFIIQSTKFSDILQAICIIIWAIVIPVAVAVKAWFIWGDRQITGSILVGLAVWFLWNTLA